MDEKLKSIIAAYTRQSPDAITAETRIDRTALGSSIHVHRFFATLAQAGYAVNNYQSIITVAQLLQQFNGSSLPAEVNHFVASSAPSGTTVQGSNEPSIGIDIEEVSSLPQTDDFREHSFYTANFSTSEIAYCILQNNPYASFAGLFAAKEALVKTNNSLRGQQFHQLVFTHSSEGKPVYPGYAVSVSHTDTTAIAVVAAPQQTVGSFTSNDTSATTKASGANFGFQNVISLLALLCSIVAIILYYKK
jgi:phosphopantetheine--protein transferase-like protein